MTLEETAKILSKAYLRFPNLTLSPDVVKIWHEDFAQVEPMTFYGALRECIFLEPECVKGFFPTVGAVHKRVVDSERRDPPPEIAWSKALECAKNYRGERKAAFSSMAPWPRIRVAILGFGYDKLLRITAPYSPTVTAPSTYEVESLKREFISIYKDAKLKKDSEQVKLQIEMPKVKSIA